VALLFSTKNIIDEGTISPGGDMPRYLMNGVYFFDLFHDMPSLTNLMDYTLHYFARYPALSLGHHPMFPSLIQVPFLKIFGISVLSARLSMVFFLLLAANVLFV